MHNPFYEYRPLKEADEYAKRLNDLIDVWGIELPDCAVLEKATMAFGNTTKIIYLKDEEKEEMTNKFKVGDKVVRTADYVALYDEGFMQEGSVYTVKALCNEKEIFLDGGIIPYSCAYFELEQPTFQNMKFRVNSPQHSKEIQEALFEMGFCWRSHGCEVRFADSFPPCDWLYTDPDGHLWRIDSEEDYLVSSFKSAQEFVVETTKSYKLIPVEIAKETPKEIITIDGKTYDKESVLNRIAALQPVLSELESINTPF